MRRARSSPSRGGRRRSRWAFSFMRQDISPGRDGRRRSSTNSSPVHIAGRRTTDPTMTITGWLRSKASLQRSDWPIRAPSSSGRTRGRTRIATRPTGSRSNSAPSERPLPRAGGEDRVVLVGRVARAVHVEIGSAGAAEFVVQPDRVHDDAFRSDPVIEPAKLDVGSRPAGREARVVAFLHLGAEQPEVFGHLRQFFLAPNRPVTGDNRLDIHRQDDRIYKGPFTRASPVYGTFSYATSAPTQRSLTADRTYGIGFRCAGVSWFVQTAGRFCTHPLYTTGIGSRP